MIYLHAEGISSVPIARYRKENGLWQLECKGMKILFSWIQWISGIQNYIVQKEESKIF